MARISEMMPGTMSYIQRYMITSHQRIKAVVDGGGSHYYNVHRNDGVVLRSISTQHK